MSKGNIEALVKAQFAALVSKDNKERLHYMVAGIKDGKFYTHKLGAIFGTFDEDAPDTVFIEESDLELSRITTLKITTVTQNMVKFFADYNGVPAETETEAEPEAESTETEPTETEPTEATKPQDDIKYSDEVVEKLAKECKKCIKKGEFKKAQKILNKLEGYDAHKKLAKKLAKAQ